MFRGWGSGSTQRATPASVGEVDRATPVSVGEADRADALTGNGVQPGSGAVYGDRASQAIGGSEDTSVAPSPVGLSEVSTFSYLVF